MRPARFDEEAEEEAARSSEWYEDRRAGLGDEFLAEVSAAVESLRESPEACTPVQGLPAQASARFVRVKGFPYRLIFTELPEELRVVAVTHDRRRPGYWLDRL